MMRHRRSLDDLEREMHDHIERETLENIERGITPVEARDAALRAFGRPLQVAEETRGVWIPAWVDQLSQDVRCAIRNMRHHPIAAMVAIFSIAAGVGAATVTLVVRDAVFRNAPPTYRQPARLSRVQIARPDDPLRPIGNRVPAGLYRAWHAALGEQLAGSAAEVVREVRTADRTVTMPTRAVTASLFPVLGVQPIVGRTLPAPVAAGAPAPVVLSHGAWRELFDGRPECVGRPLWIDNQPFVVSGVMPERFWYGETNSPIWTVLDVERLSDEDALDVVIRRPAAATPASLEDRLRPAMVAYARQLPSQRRQLALALSGIEGTPLGRQVSVALPYFLGMAVLLTLLIACANVAVLTIAQWTARQHEVGIRAAIGASRARLVRALLTESMVVAAAGGTLAVAATLALRAFVQRSAGAAFLDLSIHPGVFIWAGLLVLLAGFLVGLAPALQQTRGLQHDPLRAIASRDRAHWRHALVVLEVALTVALLVQTSALVDGYRRWMQGTMGYDAGSLVAARVENQAGVQVTRLLEIVRALPGVESAAASSVIPFGGRGTTVRVSATSTGEAIAVERAEVGASFLSVLGVPLRAGQDFAEAPQQAPRTAIVSETLAARLFPGGHAVGGTIWVDGIRHDVVGVAADYSNHPLQPAGAVARLFTPLGPGSPQRLGFVLRSREPALLVQVVRRTLQDATAGNTVARSYTVEQVLQAGGQEILAGTAPLVPLVAIGLLMTAAGVYGVLAFVVSRRARELAVRAAVGASGAHLVHLVVVQMVKLVATGVGLGGVLMFALSRVIRAAGGAGGVFDPSPIAFAVPLLVIGAIAIIAAWLPARRASSIDPVVLLRTT
jgi:putative ABC transport system permease protein